MLGLPLDPSHLPCPRAWFRALLSLVRDEHGQDLIEYALLTAGIGLAGAAAWTGVRAAIGSTYTSWDSNVDSIWESPAPQ